MSVWEVSAGMWWTKMEYCLSNCDF